MDTEKDKIKNKIETLEKEIAELKEYVKTLKQDRLLLCEKLISFAVQGHQSGELIHQLILQADKYSKE